MSKIPRPPPTPIPPPPKQIKYEYPDPIFWIAIFICYTPLIIIIILSLYYGDDWDKDYKEKQEQYQKCLIVCSGYEVYHYNIDKNTNKLICICVYSKGVKIVDK